MKNRPFKQVDVFTDQPYFGNPLAVVLDGSGLNDAAMQRFAQWTNLSETAFVLPPTEPSADYRVRIFTPGGELPFAGHPTLGTCHAWLEAGGVPKRQDVLVQQCEIGLVHIRRDPSNFRPARDWPSSGQGGGKLAFAAPSLKRSAPSPAVLAQVAAALGLKAQHIIAAQLLDNGPVWLGLLLDSADAVLQLEPDHRALKKHGLKVGVVGAHAAQATPVLIARKNREARAFAGAADASPEETASDFEVRAFAAPMGIQEDPVTGSLNASLAQWLMAEGHTPDSYVVAQGTCLGRAGRVHLSRENAGDTAQATSTSSGQVWVGGESVTCMDGSVKL